MTGLVTVGINALAASVLLNAGLVKLAAPTGLGRALRELFAAASAVDTRVVRLLAFIELILGLGLLALATRTVASLALVALGLGFAFLGAAGWRAGSRAPCGCMGGHSDKPLGVTNVVVGVGLACVLPVNLLIGVPQSQASDYSPWAVIAASLGSVLLCLWMNRRLALNLLKPAAVSAGREGAP